MAQCSAPVNGHRTESGRANCPVCGRYGGRYRRYIFFPQYSGYSSGTNCNATGREWIKAHWAPAGSSVRYTSSEIRTLTPIRESVEKRIDSPELRDVFLCHAWDDRKTTAKELHDTLETKGVSVWFSEKDVPLGTTLLREIDKGLANSKIGIVLVTPSFLARIKGDAESVASKELSALLAQDRLIPVVHQTSFEELREISPLLASRSGLSTVDDSFETIADKVAELFTILSGR